MPSTQKKKTLSRVGKIVEDVQKGTTDLFNRIATEGITDNSGNVLVEPTTPKLPNLPLLGGAVTGAAGGGETPSVPKDTFGDRLTEAVTGLTTGPTYREEKETLEKEAGVAGMKESVGSFEEEIAKTQTLLDELEGDITQRTREYLVSEQQRRRVLATEQDPLIKQLGTLERGYGTAASRLESTQADILTELGLMEKEKTEPLELLSMEMNIRKSIKDLADQNIPGVVSSTFDDAGNMTIVTQDPTTGAFNTQTLPGIGKKAEKYQTITSSIDNEGNLTIIGVTRDGKAESLGVFKGAGKAVGTEITDQGRVDQVSDYFESVKDDQGKISADDYIAAQRSWIGSGGNITDFKSAYPTDMIKEEQFINSDWFINTYGEEALKESAKEGGFTKGGGIFGIGVGKEGINDYIDSVMKSVEAWRAAGKTDKEILTEMLKD